MSTKNIVFIHGMFMTPLCWEHWITRFQAQGFTCTAPAWPGRDKPVEMLRASQGRLANRLRKIPRIQASVFDL